MLLLTGTADTTVYPRNSENLAAQVRAHGGRADVKEFDGIGHRGIIAAISWPLRWLAPTLDDIVAFFRQHDGRKA
jgi:predicted esterase